MVLATSTSRLNQTYLYDDWRKKKLVNDLDLLDVDKVKELNNIFNMWIMLNFIKCTRDPVQFQPFLNTLVIVVASRLLAFDSW